MELGFHHHQLEQFEDGDVHVIVRLVLAEDMESSAADAEMFAESVLVVVDELLYSPHLVGRHMVYLHHQMVGWLHEVVEFSAVAVHLSRDGDGGTLRLQFVGILLADFESLAIEHGVVEHDGVAHDEVLHRLPGCHRVALRRLDGLEVRRHRLLVFRDVDFCYHKTGIL